MPVGTQVVQELNFYKLEIFEHSSQARKNRAKASTSQQPHPEGILVKDEDLLLFIVLLSIPHLLPLDQGSHLKKTRISQKLGKSEDYMLTLSHVHSPSTSSKNSRYSKKTSISGDLGKIEVKV
jgi:hypothetical protein